METLGQKFTAAREKKKMTLSRAAALTRIKVQHLELMENDDFSSMPAPTYAKGFIRIYSELLNIDPEPLVREYVEKHLDLNVGSVSSQSRGKKVRAERKSDKAPDGASLDVVKQLKRSFEQLWNSLQKIVPRLPHVVVTVVAVFVLVGMVRCAVRIGGEPKGNSPRPNMLDSQAIMKEPPVRYLEIPKTEDEQP